MVDEFVNGDDIRDEEASAKMKKLDDLLKELSPDLQKDVKEAIRTLEPQAIRLVVDLYYQLQENRKRAGNQTRAAFGDIEPHAFVRWLTGSMFRLEKAIVLAMDIVTRKTEPGQWLMSVYGVGPVLAAGLLAHIDITKAPTPSAIWSFAGLNPNQEWLGEKKGSETIDRILGKNDMYTEDDVRKLCFELNRKVDTVIRHAKTPPRITLGRLRRQVDVEDFEDFLDGKREWSGQEEIDHLARIITEFSTTEEEIEDILAEVTIQPRITYASLTKAIARRPWNANLKTLRWKVGDSFVKFHRREQCLYGHLYAERKEIEVRKNNAGEFAEQAAETLRTRTFKNADVRRVYESGRLPDGRVDLRARRHAVKIFLAHLHHVMYETHYGKPPVRPYILEKEPEKHTRYIPVPNWPLKK